MYKSLFFFSLLLLSLFTTSCKNDDSPAPGNSNTGNNNTPTTYIEFKVDGTLVSFTNSEVSATRSSPNGDPAATFNGQRTGATNPNVEFFFDSGIIGVVAGLNVGMDDGTYPNNYYFEYTDASGTLYSTQYSDGASSEGIDLYVSSSSYTNGGTIQGTFSGTIRSSGNALKNITEGKYKLTFSN